MIGNEPESDGFSMDFGISFCYLDRKNREVGNSQCNIKISELSELKHAIEKFNKIRDSSARNSSVNYLDDGAVK